jgi:hypothetical protein
MPTSDTYFRKYARTQHVASVVRYKDLAGLSGNYKLFRGLQDLTSVAGELPPVNNATFFASVNKPMGSQIEIT